MDNTQLVVKGEQALTAEQFHALAEVPPEIEWFANITNPCTRVAYKVDVQAFARFVGIRAPEECRLVPAAPRSVRKTGSPSSVRQRQGGGVS